MIRTLLAMLVAPTQAPQQPPAAPALPIDAMCSTRGVYQYAFGSTDLPPSLMPMPGFDRRDLPPDAAPFKTVALDATKWSNRFYRAGFDAQFADEAQARAAVARIAAQFRARGWIAKEGAVSDDISLLHPDPAPGDVHFYSEPGGLDPAKRTGVRAALDHIGPTLSLTCDDLPLLEAHAREALGDLPEGTPKPIAAILPRPAALDPKACTTPEGQARLDAVLGGKPDDVTRLAAAQARYHERIVTWKSDRLRKSGKVAPARLSEIALGGLVRGSGGNPMQGLAIAAAMMRDAERYATLAKAGDKPAACRVAVTLVGRIATIDQVTGPQWRGIEIALDAEAKRVGVSWD